MKRDTKHVKPHLLACIGIMSSVPVRKLSE